MFWTGWFYSSGFWGDARSLDRFFIEHVCHSRFVAFYFSAVFWYPCIYFVTTDSVQTEKLGSQSHDDLGSHLCHDYSERLSCVSYRTEVIIHINIREHGWIGVPAGRPLFWFSKSVAQMDFFTYMSLHRPSSSTSCLSNSCDVCSHPLLVCWASSELRWSRNTLVSISFHDSSLFCHMFALQPATIVQKYK